MMLLRREAPAQAEAAREALGRTVRTGKEHSVIGNVESGPRGVVTEGEPFTVAPNREDLKRVIQSNRPALDFHTHPRADMYPVGSEARMFDISPSEDDLAYYRFYYPDRSLYPTAPELRTVIASPPGRGQRTAYNLFVTNEPSSISSDVGSKVREELIEAGRRGRFRSVADDPLFRDLLVGQNMLGTALEDAGALALMKHRAQQGKGRQELLLSGRPLTSDPRATNVELFRRMEPTMMDVLREKRFARGGLNQVKECCCG
jgi:hypothetical protein